MLLAPHILVGAAIAANSPTLLLGVIFAFLSHFLLDAIPHWEYSIKPLENIKIKGRLYCMPIFRRIAIDIFVGLIILMAALKISANNIPFALWAFGGFFGILPDGLAFLLFLRPKNKILASFLKIIYAVHRRLHYDKEKRGIPPLRIGLATQAIAILLSLYFLVF